MGKAIELLESHVKAFQLTVDLFESGSPNKAVTETSANEAKQAIVDLQKAIIMLRNTELLMDICAGCHYYRNGRRYGLHCASCIRNSDYLEDNYRN